MDAAAPRPKENMGEPLPRVDARLKVTGQAGYPADLPASNVAYGALATSSIAKGKVTTLHLDEARAVPGLLDIVTYGDMDRVDRPKFGNGSATRSDRCMTGRSSTMGRSSPWPLPRHSRRLKRRRS